MSLTFIETAGYHSAVSKDRTTLIVQQYLNDLADAGGDASAEPIVRELLGKCVNRLHQLCATMLYRSYPRLALPPLNLPTEGLISSDVERIHTALRQVRTDGV